MDEQKKDDLSYVCSLIEFIVRKTNSDHRTVIGYFGKEDIERQLRLASVNHSLSFEQVSDEIINEYNIPVVENKKTYKYQIPSVQSIGRVYQMLICAVCLDGDIVGTLINVFNSFICDEISDYNSNIYYSNPDYLRCSYLEGKMLA